MRRSYYNNTSFLDLLFNFLLATTILLVIAVLHIVVEKNKADIKTQAEFCLTLSWDKEKDVDVDVWVEDPDQMLLWYRQKEIGIMHVDRDDKGHIPADWYKDKNDKIIYNPNQEIVTIRGIKKGEWIINLHMFRALHISLLPIEVDVTLIKLNPQASLVFQKKVALSEYWEQKTIARVLIADSGTVLEVKEGPFKDLIQQKIKKGQHSNPPNDYERATRRDYL